MTRPDDTGNWSIDECREGNSFLYRFESKWDPDVSSGVEVRGRCQHPIVEGSGTGGFEGVSGRLDFKDIIGDPVTYVYRGHISLR